MILFQELSSASRSGKLSISIIIGLRNVFGLWYDPEYCGFGVWLINLSHLSDSWKYSPHSMSMEPPTIFMTNRSAQSTVCRVQPTVSSVASRAHCRKAFE